MYPSPLNPKLINSTVYLSDPTFFAFAHGRPGLVDAVRIRIAWVRGLTFINVFANVAARLLLVALITFTDV